MSPSTHNPHPLSLLHKPCPPPCLHPHKLSSLSPLPPYCMLSFSGSSSSSLALMPSWLRWGGMTQGKAGSSTQLQPLQTWQAMAGADGKEGVAGWRLNGRKCGGGRKGYHHYSNTSPVPCTATAILGRTAEKEKVEPLLEERTERVTGPFLRENCPPPAN